MTLSDPFTPKVFSEVNLSDRQRTGILYVKVGNKDVNPGEPKKPVTLSLEIDR